MNYFKGLFLFAFLLSGCTSSSTHVTHRKVKAVTHVFSDDDTVPGTQVSFEDAHTLYRYPVDRTIRIRQYFSFFDSLIAAIDTFPGWRLDEYILIHANYWILDTLRSYDYYTMMQDRDSFVYDQKEMIVLHPADTFLIPDSIWTSEIRKKLSSTYIDVNIPEFRLRIIQAGDTILNCPVRVGRNAHKYLVVAGRQVNLRTPIGEGEIIRVNRNPDFVNPATGKKYTGTHRDDGKFTMMPLIPWLEPSINGIRYGAMIHPTTNPETLGQAYSHGCIGTSEKDAWTVYYNAPLGTKVIFRYDLDIVNENGDTTHLQDVYHLFDK